ncbi:hypothetical protein GL267_003300 [Acidithiobacillus ferrianus]|uniref:Uncharacterized protein n=1 Tax=Acidithiobacillus ferrianus TaxID=2678518 RepID=A0ACD5HC45_9PROT|nr:hypothetical protein [Acidithiobacillus ferrianus]
MCEERINKVPCTNGRLFETISESMYKPVNEQHGVSEPAGKVRKASRPNLCYGFLYAGEALPQRALPLRYLVWRLLCRKFIGIGDCF